MLYFELASALCHWLGHKLAHLLVNQDLLLVPRSDVVYGKLQKLKRTKNRFLFGYVGNYFIMFWKQCEWCCVNGLIDWQPVQGVPRL